MEAVYGRKQNITMIIIILIINNVFFNSQLAIYSS